VRDSTDLFNGDWLVKNGGFKGFNQASNWGYFVGISMKNFWESIINPNDPNDDDWNKRGGFCQQRWHRISWDIMG
jgi:hypothetical protein